MIYTEVIYGFSMTPFGRCGVLIGDRKIIYVGFFVQDVQLIEMIKQPLKVHRNDKLVESMIDEMLADSSSQKTLSLISIQGTSFQQQVWQTLVKIPYATTISYQEVAERIGKPQAVRAVARAIASNKIAYFIPCHRVINKNGKLGGYRWGLSLKKTMLSFEKSHS